MTTTTEVTKECGCTPGGSFGSWCPHDDVYVECKYCGHTVSEWGDQLPGAGDGEQWGWTAEEHDKGCEWVRTRAHRVFFRLAAVLEDGSRHYDEEHLGPARHDRYGTEGEALAAIERLDDTRPEGHEGVTYQAEAL